MFRASRLRRTVLFAGAHGARKRSPPIRVTPLSRLPHRQHGYPHEQPDEKAAGPAALGKRSRRLSATWFISLWLPIVAFAPAASRTSRPLQFFHRAAHATRRKNRFLRSPPLAVAIAIL